jgi:hypothetical protein
MKATVVPKLTYIGFTVSLWPGVDDECVEKLKLWKTGIEK